MNSPALIRLFGSWVVGQRPATLRADAFSGLSGALLVLPQAFAFATFAGLPPAVGLAAAIVPCGVAARFGSSLDVVSGPKVAQPKTVSLSACAVPT